MSEVMRPRIMVITACCTRVTGCANAARIFGAPTLSSTLWKTPGVCREMRHRACIKQPQWILFQPLYCNRLSRLLTCCISNLWQKLMLLEHSAGCQQLLRTYKNKKQQTVKTNGNLHCVSKKVPTFEMSVTLSNLNRFSKFLHCWKCKKFATKPISHYHLTLGTLLHYTSNASPHYLMKY